MVLISHRFIFALLEDLLCHTDSTNFTLMIEMFWYLCGRKDDYSFTHRKQLKYE